MRPVRPVRPGPRVLSPKQQKSSPTTHAQTRDGDGTAARRRISHRVAPRLAWAGLAVLLPRFCCRCAGGAQRARRQHKQEAPKLYPHPPDMDMAAVSRSAVQRNATHRASSGDLKRRSTPLALPIHYGARPNGSRRAHAPYKSSQRLSSPHHSDRTGAAAPCQYCAALSVYMSIAITSRPMNTSCQPVCRRPRRCMHTLHNAAAESFCVRSRTTNMRSARHELQSTPRKRSEARPAPRYTLI